MIQITENPMILVDASSYAYRAYHAFPPLTNSNGEPTGAMYGVLSMLKSLLMHYQPSHIAVVFDSDGKTFRDKLFKHYKSHRPPMPDNLRKQIAPLHDMVMAMGLPLLVISGVEADDVIGTLAYTAAHSGQDVIISTSDKDMAQLVSPQITLLNTMSNTILGPEEVRLKFGVSPELIVDYLALIGDSSDNIPGVPGVGEKTAQALLYGLGGLKTIYQHLDSISSLSFRGAKTIAAKLKQYREVAFLSYKLATIKTDLPLDLPCDGLMVKKPEFEALMLLFQRYEFKRWQSELETGRWLYGYKNTTEPTSLVTTSYLTGRPKEYQQELSRGNYDIIDTMEALETWINVIYHAGAFAFNIETDGFDILTANLIGLCFAVKPGKAAYLPVGHNYTNAPDQLDCMAVLAVLKTVFEDPIISKIGQNLKFNYGVLKRYNIELTGIAFDITLESYILDSLASRHDLDSLAVRFLQHIPISFEDIAGKGRDQLTFNQISMEQAAPYAAEDADIMLRLHQKLWPRIEQTPELKKVFEEIEMPLVPVLSRIEHTGVLIDESILVTHSMELAKRLEDMEGEAYLLAEEPFNLSSIKQLQVILYDKQKLPVLKKTPRGAPSTNEEVLAELALDYPLPKLILEYRSLAKLKSSYTDKLLQMINPVSRRIHTSYHQVVTATGRLSSSTPNLQNIPVRNNEGRRIRQAFVAPSGAFIVAADYSQIELRIMAHLSRDPKLLSYFATGKDIHLATAAEVFEVSLNKVTPEQRRRAKAINFGLIYGMSAFGLAHELSISRSEAQKYMNLYFNRHPYIWEYMERTRRNASNLGYVETLDGRRLYLPHINSNNSMRKKSAERAAINAPMQGTAADIIKRAMIAVDDWLQQEAPPVRMIMQVHDELVFEVHHDVIESATARIKALMEGCFKLDVPLQVVIGVGENWDKATK